MKTGKADCRPAQGEAAGARVKKPDTERENPPATRAVLEKFLREPALLTDDDVMELLTFLFHGEAVQKKLDTLTEKRKKTLPPFIHKLFPAIEDKYGIMILNY